MILVDTSVWVDHLRAGDGTLAGLLEVGSVLSHAFVIGELALGDLRQRDLVLATLQDLPQASVATDREVRTIGLGSRSVALARSTRRADDAAPRLSSPR
jgi:predicted nucleic acid-binding protein